MSAVSGSQPSLKMLEGEWRDIRLHTYYTVMLDGFRGETPSTCSVFVKHAAGRPQFLSKVICLCKDESDKSLVVRWGKTHQLACKSETMVQWNHLKYDGIFFGWTRYEWNPRATSSVYDIWRGGLKLPFFLATSPLPVLKPTPHQDIPPKSELDAQETEGLLPAPPGLVLPSPPGLGMPLPPGLASQE